jgi:hypothetical protein
LGTSAAFIRQQRSEFLQLVDGGLVESALELLFLAHFVFVAFATFDLHSHYSRQRGSKPQSYPGFFMAGILFVIFVPVLGGLMWWYVRRQVGRW